MEPQNPSGPRPPSRPEPEKNEPAVWISPRLRDKLGDEDPKLPREREGPPAWVGIVLLVMVLGGGGGLLMLVLSGNEKEKAEAARLAEQAAADSVAQHQRDSVAFAAARDTAAARAATGATAAATTPAQPAPATPAPAPAARPAGPAAANADAPSAPPAPAGPFGINVASFIVEDRANSEQERLAAATGLAGRVVAGDDGNYSVILGSFRSRAAAERAAEPLLARGLVNEARVVPLKP